MGYGPVDIGTQGTMSLTTTITKGTQSVLRTFAASLENLGRSLEGEHTYVETLNPSTRILGYNGKKPEIDPESVFVAPSATVQGNVSIGAHSSVWYGATIRADTNTVKIGKNTSIGDLSVIQGTTLGDNVVVGASSVLHACTLQDGCKIGQKSIIMDGAVIEKGAIVEGGSIIPPGAVVKSNEVWAGIPATMVRALTVDEMSQEVIEERAFELSDLSKIHMQENAKGLEQQIDERYHFKMNQGVPGGDNFDPKDVQTELRPGSIFDRDLSDFQENPTNTQKAGFYQKS